MYFELNGCSSRAVAFYMGVGTNYPMPLYPMPKYPMSFYPMPLYPMYFDIFVQ